jgi:hypothetical protein
MKHITNLVGTAPLSSPVERSATGWLIRALERLKSCAQIFFATLHEIFDESAYARFLEQKHLVSSRVTYAAFRRESEAAKARRPKCC